MANWPQEQPFGAGVGVAGAIQYETVGGELLPRCHREAVPGTRASKRASKYIDCGRVIEYFRISNRYGEDTEWRALQDPCYCTYYSCFAK